MEQKKSVEEVMLGLKALDSVGRLVAFEFNSKVSDSPAEPSTYEVRCDIWYEEAGATGNPAFDSILVEDGLSLEEVEPKIASIMDNVPVEVMAYGEWKYHVKKEEVVDEVSDNV